MTIGGSNTRSFHEFLYDFVIDDVSPEVFAGRIQSEVDELGGCVIVSKHEDRISTVTVAFPERDVLEKFVRQYYEDGGLDEPAISRELLLIRET